METLQTYRDQIDQIDQEMRKLFIQRMETVALIADWKSSHDIPVFDSSREEIIIKRNVDGFERPEYKEFYQEVLLSILKVSKDYQKVLVLRGII